MINNDSPVHQLLAHQLPWIHNENSIEHIAISSRIRIARNLKAFAFPILANEKEREKIIENVFTTCQQIPALENALYMPMKSLDEHAKQILVERRLMSPQFLAGEPGCALIVDSAEKVSVMINEEDHIRIQTILSGFSLRECSDLIFPIERQIDQKIPLAYLDPFGYLTACPTNVGTGMRVSVMLHLPALVITEQIPTIARSAATLGLTIRGIMGEGTDNTGNLYQISNQSTLGDTEAQIIERIETVIHEIIGHEKNMRERLMTQRKYQLLNHIGRAYGALKYAHILSTKEAITALSALWLGCDLALFPELKKEVLNQLFLHVQSAHLTAIAEKDIEVEARDIFRAKLVRDALNNMGAS